MSICSHKNAYIHHVFCPDCHKVWKDGYPAGFWILDLAEEVKRLRLANARLEDQNFMLRDARRMLDFLVNNCQNASGLKRLDDGTFICTYTLNGREFQTSPHKHFADAILEAMGYKA